MTVALLIISDGRDAYLEQTLASADVHLPFHRFDQVVHIDDRDHRLGFAGAIQAGWDRITTSHVFHLEQDFTFNEPVDLAAMIAVLDTHQHLAQLVLKRQPWNPQEHAAGGIVEQHPDDYTERTDGQHTWTEHRRFFSTNPSLYPARLCRIGWPQTEHSEGVFTHQMLKDPHLRFAFWGAKYDPPRVAHIGEHRAGNGY